MGDRLGVAEQDAAPGQPVQEGGRVPPDRLTVPVCGELAAVMHKEATRAGELVCLPGNHPEGQFLVRQVSTWQLQRLGNVVWVDVNRARRLVKPASLELLQAVLGQLIVGLARAVIVRCHVGSYTPS